VATLSGRLTEESLGRESAYGTAYGTHEASDGSRSLTAIYPAKKKVALEFDQSADASQSTAASPAN
jgi:hypothetical protein